MHSQKKRNKIESREREKNVRRALLSLRSEWYVEEERNMKGEGGESVVGMQNE